MTRDVSPEEAKRLRAQNERVKQSPPTEDPQPRPPGTANGSGRHLKRTGWHELSTIEAQDQLVHGLIGSNQLVVLYGESGSGKSFLAFDFGAHFALSREWLGRAVAGGGVLYIAAEGRGGWSNRVAAFCQHHALDDEARVMVPFQFILESINLGRNAGLDVAAVIEAAREASEEFGRPVRLIIVDTAARAMPGANENDPVDMGAFVSSVDAIREQTGATVVIVHHSGKNAALGARGHSSLRAAVDTELEVERTNGSRMLRVRKSRDGHDGAEQAFKLDVVEIGRDAEDQPITSCVIAGADAAEHRKAKSAKAKSLAHWQLAADYFNNTLIDFPESVVPSNGGLPTGIPITTVDRFREALIQASIIDGETPSSRRVQWKRIKDTLIKKGMMRINGDYCWRADWKATADA
jgi:KaiC/GvpD/RAD55 family RecA-like ATPase